jgi:hypothetical protein
MNLTLPFSVLMLAVLSATFGTPHIRAEYLCEADGRGRCYSYLRCTYLGLQGTRTFVPFPYGQGCPGIKLFPIELPRAS